MTDFRITDAKNRALRTLVQNFVLDFLVAVTLAINSFIVNANDWTELDWTILSFTIFKTFWLTLSSYVTRATLDEAGITPKALQPKTSQVTAPEQPKFFRIDDQGYLIASSSAPA